MRKQDRIANNQQQRRSQETTKKESPSESMDREQVKGGVSEAPRPKREPGGRLPLPD